MADTAKETKPRVDESADPLLARLEGPSILPTVGGAVWLLWSVVTRPEWTVVILMMSPFVLVPLGLRLASDPSTGPTTDLLRRIRTASIPLALVAALSFSVDTGAVAALLTVPWLLLTITVATVGLFRFLSRRRFDEPGIGVDAGLAFLAVGGAWLTLTRMGANPLGFSDVIVRLTAVHFHYAGFALPIAAGLVAIRSKRSWLFPLSTIFGVPLTAIGITTGGLLEWFAATVMACAGIAVAGTMIRHAGELSGWPSQLLRLAGCALIVGMGLALLYSWSNGFDLIGLDYLTIPTIDWMVRTHGSLNALGFGLLALVALTATQSFGSSTGVNHRRNSFHLGRPSNDHLAALQAEAATTEPDTSVGLLSDGQPNGEIPDGFRLDIWQRPIDNFDDAKAAIVEWAGHKRAGIACFPSRAPIEVGQTVSLAIPVGPISTTATSRIVDVIDEVDRFGFTYLALPHHPERGEESFIVHRRNDQPSVASDADLDATGGTVEVTAVWSTGGVASDLLRPLTRFLQRRAIERYLVGIAGR